MGRSGIAMTFVTDQELKALKSLLVINRIDPVWQGFIPDLRTAARGHGRPNGKKQPKKRSGPAARHQAFGPQTRKPGLAQSFDAAQS